MIPFCKAINNWYRQVIKSYTHPVYVIITYLVMMILVVQWCPPF